MFQRSISKKYKPFWFWKFCSFSFAFKNGHNFPSDHGPQSNEGQKIESAQKIHASRGCCEVHENQFWWAWHFHFRKFCSFNYNIYIFQFWLNFLSEHELYSPWSKIESAQKFHSERSRYACTPSLVSPALPVSEILSLFVFLQQCLRVYVGLAPNDVKQICINKLKNFFSIKISSLKQFL